MLTMSAGLRGGRVKSAEQCVRGPNRRI